MFVVMNIVVKYVWLLLLNATIKICYPKRIKQLVITMFAQACIPELRRYGFDEYFIGMLSLFR